MATFNKKVISGDTAENVVYVSMAERKSGYFTLTKSDPTFTTIVEKLLSGERQAKDLIKILEPRVNVSAKHGATFIDYLLPTKGGHKIKLGFLVLDNEKDPEAVAQCTTELKAHKWLLKQTWTANSAVPASEPDVHDIEF